MLPPPLPPFLRFRYLPLHSTLFLYIHATYISLPSATFRYLPPSTLLPLPATTLFSLTTFRAPCTFCFCFPMAFIPRFAAGQQLQPGVLARMLFGPEAGPAYAKYEAVDTLLTWAGCSAAADHLETPPCQIDSPRGVRWTRAGGGSVEW
jgi:hypothetical protein